MAIYQWMNGNNIPSRKYVLKIWQLSKDEIGPNYWYFELPNEISYMEKSEDLKPEVS